MTVDLHQVKQQNNNMIEESKQLTMYLQQVKLHNNNLIQENNKLTLQLSNLKENIHKFLNDDQIMKFSQPRVQWTTKTIKMALKIKTATSKNGYEFVR